MPPNPALPTLHFEPGSLASIDEIAAAVMHRAADSGKPRALVLVDGTGGSGKSTFAEQLASRLHSASLIAVDDIAWHLHPINWTDALLDGVVRPWLAGAGVDYRPPGWVAKNRPGSVRADGRSFLVIEGIGAGRHALAELATFIVWVNCDPDIAFERMIVRDMELGVNGVSRAEVEAFANSYLAEEVPFQLVERPWDRADLIVAGDAQRTDELLTVIWR